MNLDGETNLKERNTPPETKLLEEEEVINISGAILCEKPNENLEKWDAVLTITDFVKSKIILR